MIYSAEFHRFGLQFIQDIELMGNSLEELLHNVLSPFRGEERTRLRAFLDEATKDNVSDEDLQKLWNSTPSDVYFRDTSELRAMLKTARDRL